MLSAVPNKTETIYSLICDCKYEQVIELLLSELTGTNSQSRALLSLIAYCFYHLQDFVSAANYYEKLTRYYGYVEEYRVYYVQSLWKAGLYDDAIRASQSASIISPKYRQQMLFLRASIKYEVDDLNGCLSILNSSSSSKHSEELNIEYMIGRGCTLFKEDKFAEAKKLLVAAQNIIGFRPDLAYNIAACHYMLKNYEEMDKIVDDIIAKGAQKNPNLSVGSGSNLPDGVEIKSVGMSHALKQTALIEAFNLRVAKEYQLSNFQAANASMAGMPPRSESELDHITLHNTALLELLEPSTLNEGLRKLNFLITQQSFPPETFQNLLICYIKHALYDLAADVLAENAHLHELYLDKELYDLLDAVITSSSSSAADADSKKFQDLGNRHIENLRTLTKKLNESKESGDTLRMKETVNEYLLSLEKYIQVLMYQANLHWQKDEYSAIQLLFEKSREFCENHDVWKLNYAHTLFMLQTPSAFAESIRIYECIVHKFGETSILNVTAMVLANLCVAYIMTSQNEEAEELMRQIEREQERQLHLNQSARQHPGNAAAASPRRTRTADSAGAAAQDHDNGNLYHLCIVNLVIGTLYCCKANYVFGIQRIIKSLEPLEKKLSPDTWYHTKRCLLSYLQMLTKQIYLLSSETEQEVQQFLERVEQIGASMSSTIQSNSKTIAYEARMLKMYFLKLYE